MKNKPIIYIASPYTKGDPCINAHCQMKLFDQMLTDGIVLPYIPLLSHFQHTCFPRSYEDWIEYDKGLLRVFDACLRVDAKLARLGYEVTESNGADGEMKWFALHGKPIFKDINKLYYWAKHTWELK